MLFGSKKSSNGTSGDWADQAAGAIEGFIDGLHDRAIVPLLTAARIVVYGLLAAIVGTATIILFAIALVRFIDIYLGNLVHLASVVWLADLIAGAIFVAAGLFLWSGRHSKTP
jgi:uncharacterized MAPEG superfamily protein